MGLGSTLRALAFHAGAALCLLSSPAASQAVGPTATAAVVEAAAVTPLQQSVGCAVTGSAATALALLVGLQRVTGVFSGGEPLVESSGGLNVGLAGLVFASFCAVGQALTPLYLQLFEPPRPVAANRGRPSRLPVDEAGLVPASLDDRRPVALGTCAFRHGPLARYVNVC